MWRLVLLDFDGVLCDSGSMAIEQVEDLRRQARFSALPSPRESGHFGEIYRGELRHSLRRFGIPDSDARDFFRAHATAMRGQTSGLDLFDGVRDGLLAMPNDSYAIITSAYSETVQEVLRRGSVPTDGIEIIGHEVRETKTEKARRLLSRRGCPIEDAIYVGDMESDIQYCSALGLRCIGVTYGYHPAELIRGANPFDLARSPQELFSKLRKGCIHEGSSTN